METFCNRKFSTYWISNNPIYIFRRMIIFNSNIFTNFYYFKIIISLKIYTIGYARVSAPSPIFVVSVSNIAAILYSLRVFIVPRQGKPLRAISDYRRRYPYNLPARPYALSCFWRIAALFRFAS